MKSFFAPGRVVITGEHSVIYGQPALTMPIKLGVRVFLGDEGKKGENFQKISQIKNNYLKDILSIFENKYGSINKNQFIKISADLPSKAGLSSSTALASALIQALAFLKKNKLEKQELLALVTEIENQQYPVSGMDQQAVVLGNLRFGVKRNGIYESKILTTKNLDFNNFKLINSGRAQESTAQMVNLVKSNYKNLEPIIKQIGQVSQKIIDNLKNNEFDLELIKTNQRLLEKLGVVGERAKKIIREIEAEGGAAKITGAGGVKGGSGMIIAWRAR